MCGKYVHHARADWRYAPDGLRVYPAQERHRPGCGCEYRPEHRLRLHGSGVFWRAGGLHCSKIYVTTPLNPKRESAYPAGSRVHFDLPDDFLPIRLLMAYIQVPVHLLPFPCEVPGNGPVGLQGSRHLLQGAAVFQLF